MINRIFIYETNIETLNAINFGLKHVSCSFEVSYLSLLMGISKSILKLAHFNALFCSDILAEQEGRSAPDCNINKT